MTKKKNKTQPDSDHDEKQAAESAATSLETEARADDQESADNGYDLPAEMETLNAELEDIKDKFLRATAETENVRRRAENDVQNARKFAVEKFAGEVLSIRDCLELARSVDLKEDNQEALKKMHEGLDLTLRQIDSVFEKFQINMVNPEGEKFNPDLHQAISMLESPEVAVNHVISVVQKGFTLNDRLLRPAMVTVSKGGGKGKNQENGQKSSENETNSS